MSDHAKNDDKKTYKRDGDAPLPRVFDLVIVLFSPEAGLAAGGGDLDGLYAANAAHLALRQSADGRGVRVHYQGALCFRGPGLEPPNRPDLWTVGTMPESAQGRITTLGLQLFDIQLILVNSLHDSDAAFAYGGHFYAFKVSDVKGRRRAGEVLSEMGMSPLDFVKEAARLVSDDKKSGQKSSSAPG